MTWPKYLPRFGLSLALVSADIQVKPMHRPRSPGCYNYLGQHKGLGSCMFMIKAPIPAEIQAALRSISADMPMTWPKYQPRF